MADPFDGLRQANEDFYAALESLDIDAMERQWLHHGWVRCVHPGWDALVGWDDVRRSWARIFDGTRWLRVATTGVDATVVGDVGIVACAENITSERDGDVGVAVAQATNLFQRTPDGWRLFVHHASPSPLAVTRGADGSVS